MSKTTAIATAFAAMIFADSTVLAQTVEPSQSAGRVDLLIADFEGDTYGEWKTTGEAFGEGPARANVKPRNRVTGHQGQGLVNTYLDGDLSTGTLTSPPFTIQRRHINFLIGAGNYLRSHLHQPAGGWKSRPHRRRTGPEGRRKRSTRLAIVGRRRVGRQRGGDSNRRQRDRRLGTHQRRSDRAVGYAPAAIAGRLACREAKAQDG